MNNNILKNDISNFIASEAISLKLDTNFENRVINEDLFKTIHQKHALHALASINRKYIFFYPLRSKNITRKDFGNS